MRLTQLVRTVVLLAAAVWLLRTVGVGGLLLALFVLWQVRRMARTRRYRD